MIARIWHGFTSINNADEYENMLRKDVLPGIGRVKGYKGAQLLRRNHPDEVEFITITYFDDMAAVIAFAGRIIPKQLSTLKQVNYSPILMNVQSIII